MATRLLAIRGLRSGRARNTRRRPLLVPFVQRLAVDGANVNSALCSEMRAKARRISRPSGDDDRRTMAHDTSFAILDSRLTYRLPMPNRIGCESITIQSSIYRARISRRRYIGGSQRRRSISQVSQMPRFPFRYELKSVDPVSQARRGTFYTPPGCWRRRPLCRRHSGNG